MNRYQQIVIDYTSVLFSCWRKYCQSVRNPYWGVYAVSYYFG